MALLLMSCASQEKNSMTGQETVIEWAPFKVKKGVSQEQVFEVSARLQKEFLQEQEGFLRRELLSTREGNYVDLVLWQSDEHAQKAMEAASTNEAAGRYFGLMDFDPTDPAAAPQHLRRLRTYTTED